MSRAPHGKGGDRLRAPRSPDLSGDIAAGMRPTAAQRRYLERGLTQAGGKLPLFDADGREVSRKTIESCLSRGWTSVPVPTFVSISSTHFYERRKPQGH